MHRLSSRISVVVSRLVCLLLFIGTLLVPGSAHAESWQYVADLPAPRDGLSAVEHQGMIYVFGGQMWGQLIPSVDVYDPATNVWASVSNMPLPRHSFGIAKIGSLVYIIGGQVNEFTSTDRVDVYHLDFGFWSQAPPLPEPRMELSAAALGQTVYAFGGSTLQGAFTIPSALGWSFDAFLNTWSAESPMAVPRAGHALVAYDGQIWALGGYVGVNGFPTISSVEIYDPAHQLWTTHAVPMSAPRSHAGVAVVNGHVYVVGGSETNLFSNGICVGGIHHFFPCTQLMDCLPGGRCERGYAESSLLELDPTTGTWVGHLHLQSSRMRLTAVGSGGSLYALGGSREWDGPLNTVERYSGYCGDGFVSGEACDDGNVLGGDGCSSSCELEVGWQCVGTLPSVCDGICGDGITVGVEGCDDGNLESCDGCDASCVPETDGCCGDGAIDADEACDDGNGQAGDGCGGRCDVEPGWSCAGEPSVCAVLCGDGLIVGAEACDDGGVLDGDGCAADCSVESGWSCEGEPSVCATECGDGTVLGAEECDDGSTLDGDGCAGDCTEEPGWTCAGEPSACTRDTLCGNGILDGAEVCDDGNHEAGDGCNASCNTEPGWTCDGEPSDCEEVSVATPGGCGCTGGSPAGLPTTVQLVLLFGALLTRRRFRAMRG